MELEPIDGYQQLLGQIAEAYNQGQVQALRAANTQLLETYWQIGQHIVEFEQEGKVKSIYGQQLLKNLSQDLKSQFGKGFSRSNLVYMRLLYLRYPIGQKPSHRLSWSHYVELLKIDDDLERSFYEKQAVAEHWSVPELKRQQETALFLRMAADRLRQLLPRDQQIQLIPIDVDRYGRAVAVVFANGRSVNLQMVKEGQAVVYPQYLSGCPNSRDALLSAEDEDRPG